METIRYDLIIAFFIIQGMMIWHYIRPSFTKDIFRFDFKCFVEFTLIMAVGMFASSLYYYLGGPTLIGDTNPYENLKSIMEFIGPQMLLSVWWEDIIYVLPFLVISKLLGDKWKWVIPMMIPSSIVFALGHLYQGPMGLVTFIFPFLSLLAARKYGFITSVAMHLVYDFSIYFYGFVIFQMIEKITI